MAMSEQRRAHFRLPYPAAERPQLESSSGPCQVLEIAEGGIRIVVSRGWHMQLGEAFEGVIHFRDQGVETVVGEVLRLDESQAVIQLTKGISLHRVMAEQSYIQQHYPSFLASEMRRR